MTHYTPKRVYEFVATPALDLKHFKVYEFDEHIHKLITKDNMNLSGSKRRLEFLQQSFIY